jgi:hypothetical protein
MPKRRLRMPVSGSSAAELLQLLVLQRVVQRDGEALREDGQLSGIIGLKRRGLCQQDDRDRNAFEQHRLDDHLFGVKLRQRALNDHLVRVIEPIGRALSKRAEHMRVRRERIRIPNAKRAQHADLPVLLKQQRARVRPVPCITRSSAYSAIACRSRLAGENRRIGLDVVQHAKRVGKRRDQLVERLRAPSEFIVWSRPRCSSAPGRSPRSCRFRRS